MTWNPEQSPDELRAALGRFDRQEASHLVRSFVDYVRHAREPIPESAARTVLAVLRRKRHFDLVTMVAEALLERGDASFRIRQDYAQGLLDRGLLTAARAFLDDLVADTRTASENEALGSDAREHARAVNVQARGLVGRSYKQAYVNAGVPASPWGASALEQAISAYWNVYGERRTDPERRWHAVNALALAERARTDEIAIRLEFEPEDVAAELVHAVRAALDEGRATVWDLAIAMEASLAAAKHSDAIFWGRHYIEGSGIDAFEVASTYRQLVEVWRLEASSSPGAELLGMLEAKLLSLEGGSVSIDASAPEADKRRLATLHRVFEGGFVHGEAYRLGLERARSVARIGRDSYSGLGSGALVRGGDLCPKLGDELLLLTNSHVVTQEPASWPYALRASEAQVSFLFGRHAEEPPIRTTVREVLWQSSLWELDACLLRLEKLPAHLAPCPVRTSPPSMGAGVERVFIAGYPGGASLHFSLFDNRVVGRDERFLHYRAAAEKGSSGSPVFDTDFRVVALHHLGSHQLPRLDAPGAHSANEGVLLSAIARAIQQDLHEKF